MDKRNYLIVCDNCAARKVYATREVYTTLPYAKGIATRLLWHTHGAVSVVIYNDDGEAILIRTKIRDTWEDAAYFAIAPLEGTAPA